MRNVQPTLWWATCSPHYNEPCAAHLMRKSWAAHLMMNHVRPNMMNHVRPTMMNHVRPTLWRAMWGPFYGESWAAHLIISHVRHSLWWAMCVLFHDELCTTQFMMNHVRPTLWWTMCGLLSEPYLKQPTPRERWSSTFMPCFRFRIVFLVLSKVLSHSSTRSSPFGVNDIIYLLLVYRLKKNIAKVWICKVINAKNRGLA